MEPLVLCVVSMLSAITAVFTTCTINSSWITRVISGMVVSRVTSNNVCIPCGNPPLQYCAYMSDCYKHCAEWDKNPTPLYYKYIPQSNFSSSGWLTMQALLAELSHRNSNNVRQRPQRRQTIHSLLPQGWPHCRGSESVHSQHVWSGDVLCQRGL